MVWRYCSLDELKPRPQQTVLAVWDYAKTINAPGYVGRERRRGVVIDTYRGEGRWIWPQYGAAYQGYYEIPDFHKWRSPYDLRHEGWYLIHFERGCPSAPRDFFLNGPYFIAQAHFLDNGGMDWLCIPNAGDRSQSHFVRVPQSAPSRWQLLDFS